MDASDITVIIDNGSGSIKAGLMTDTAPSLIVPSIIGFPRRRYRDEMGEGAVFVGEEALAQLSTVSVMNPIDHGHVDDWTHVQELWNYTFNNLNIDTSEHPFLLTEPPLCSSRHRERIAEMMFEDFSCPELNISVTGLMAIYATGQLTGVVLDIGEGVTECVPVIEGFVGKESVKRSDFGGEELTLVLKQALCERGYSLTTREEYQFVEAIKKSYCFCSMDPAGDATRSDLTVTYKLPDGKLLRDGTTSEITLGPERVYPAEALFNPQICRRDNPVLTDLIWRSIMLCPIESRKVLLSNVNICGGSTLFPGFQLRLEEEIKNTAPEQARHTVRVLGSDNRKDMVWVGASIFANSVTGALRQQVWITREEWNEIGERIVHIKAALK